jgi:hypothetical protein
MGDAFQEWVGIERAVQPVEPIDPQLDCLVPRRKLWVVQGALIGSAAPDGRAKCASATRIAVKPSACGAPLRGCGA